MADANNYDWTRYTYFIPKSFSQYDGFCSYEPMMDLIDAYWDVDGKTMRTTSLWNSVKNVMPEYGKTLKIYSSISIH
ncbi:hypothetical protein NXV42_23355 [Bacteroides fragilis]|nr:hypothetical protein [Bacteroides fragilis]